MPASSVAMAFNRRVDSDSPDVDGATELHVLKHRGGGTGYADLYFYKQWLRFEDMLDPDR